MEPSSPFDLPKPTTKARIVAGTEEEMMEAKGFNAYVEEQERPEEENPWGEGPGREQAEKEKRREEAPNTLQQYWAREYERLKAQGHERRRRGEAGQGVGGRGSRTRSWGSEMALCGVQVCRYASIKVPVYRYIGI